VQSGRERGEISYTSVPLIHSTQKLDHYKSVADSSQTTSSRQPNSTSSKPIPVLNPTKKFNHLATHYLNTSMMESKRGTLVYTIIPITPFLLQSDRYIGENLCDLSFTIR
jgi:hypothetical protein